MCAGMSTPGVWPVELWTPACGRGFVGLPAVIFVAGLICKVLSVHTNKFWDETDRVSPKIGHFPKLKALQTKPANENHSGWSHSSTATRRSSQLDGSHTRSTHPSTHKRFTCRHTNINLQATTPTQVVGSHDLTERPEQYITQALTHLNYIYSNEDIMQHLKTLILKYTYI